jgi:two-component system, OmpR family, phosphate regulon response regulator OmpR
MATALVECSATTLAPMSTTSNTNRAPMIWVVDDDPELRLLLREFLEKQGFDVRLFADGAQLEHRLERERPDLLVLDQMMPGDSGLVLCQRIRAGGDDVGIIMLTARNEPTDRIAGIERGADDYVGKPFVPLELVARIRSVLRRRTLRPPGAPIPDADVVTFGPFRIDFANRSLWRDAERVALTTTEFAVLTALARNPHRPMTRERLVELARGPGADTTERSIDVQVSRLRKLLATSQDDGQFIQTVWGYGYVFVPDGAGTAP